MLRLNPRTLGFLVSGLLLLVAAPAVPAQEIAWRTDYASALKESRERNLPLFTDCTTDPCYWCRRLDVSFRDPDITELLNTKFIPLRMHAAQYGSILRQLEVARFPTLIHSAPDGTILSMTEGFLEAAGLPAAHS